MHIRWPCPVFITHSCNSVHYSVGSITTKTCLQYSYFAIPILPVTIFDLLINCVQYQLDLTIVFISHTSSISQLLKTMKLWTPILSLSVQHRHQLQYLLVLWMMMCWRVWSSSEWGWWPLKDRRGWMLEIQLISSYLMMTVRFQTCHMLLV